MNHFKRPVVKRREPAPTLCTANSGIYPPCSTLNTHSNRKSRKSSNRNIVFIQGKFDFDSRVRGPSTEKSKDIGRPENAAMLADLLYLFLEHRSTAISGKDHEGPDRALAGMEVLVQTAG